MVCNFINVTEQDSACTIDLSANLLTTLVTVIGVGTTNLYTSDTVVSDLAGVFLSSHHNMPVKLVISP